MDFLKKIEENKDFKDFCVSAKKIFTENIKGIALKLFLMIVLFGILVLNINYFLNTICYKQYKQTKKYLTAFDLVKTSSSLRLKF